jgi:hypothetical protein
VRLPGLALALSLLAAFAAVADLGAQSSMFGVRGLGLPGRPMSPRALAMGGSYALFDGESPLNPAALGQIRHLTAGFVLTPERRTWETPAGSRSLRETRFPHAFVLGPIPRSRISLGLSLAGYADRDFRIASTDTVDIRGTPVEVSDTLESLGGMSEIRAAGAYTTRGGLHLGGGFHLLTGSARLQARRSFADTTFLPIQQKAELSYHGIGFSLGGLGKLGRSLWVAGLARSDGKARVELDSTSLYDVDLPYTFAGGLLYQPSARLQVAGHAIYRTWSGANSDLQAQGGPGSRNSLEIAVGGEVARNGRRPYHFPIRFGLRYAELPFPVRAGGEPKEYAVSAGSGTRFAREFASVDVALERVWRSERDDLKERAWQLTLGLAIRPYGPGR